MATVEDVFGHELAHEPPIPAFGSGLLGDLLTPFWRERLGAGLVALAANLLLGRADVLALFTRPPRHLAEPPGPRAVRVAPLLRCLQYSVLGQSDVRVGKAAQHSNNR